MTSDELRAKWLELGIHQLADAEAALAECEADNEGLRHDAERYHLMCNTLWEKVTATGDEDCARIAVNRITDLEHKLAECEQKVESVQVEHGSVVAELETEVADLSRKLGGCERERDYYRGYSSQTNAATRDLEGKLAECEQQRDALVGMDHAAEHYRKERDVAESKLAAAREALQAYRNFKPFDWRFDHSGAMNATALGERDVYLKIKAKADKVLVALTETGEGENKDAD